MTKKSPLQIARAAYKPKLPQALCGAVKVIEGEKGLFIAMPSRKSSDGEYRDIAHPINTQTRDKLQKIVLEAYEKAEYVEE